MVAPRFWHSAHLQQVLHGNAARLVLLVFGLDTLWHTFTVAHRVDFAFVTAESLPEVCGHMARPARNRDMTPHVRTQSIPGDSAAFQNPADPSDMTITSFVGLCTGQTATKSGHELQMGHVHPTR